MQNSVLSPYTISYELPAKPDTVQPPQQKSPKHTSLQSPHKNVVDTSSIVFDPNNSTPPSDFMNLLKQRMSVYFAGDPQ